MVGGGHSHLLALREFAMRPLRGVRITLVSREPHTPYSGMLPGYVAGHYGYDDVHVDLGPLTTAAGARLIVAEVVHLDLRARCVEFERHPPLRFDLVSLNCGAAPGFGMMPAPASAIPVKPIGRFIPRWRALLDALRARAPGPAAFRVTVVGGGAGGVELALSVHHALTGLAPSVLIVLVTAATHLLDGHSRRVQARFEAMLPARGIEVLTRFVVRDVDAVGVSDAQGRRVPSDFVLWVTGVEAPKWLRRTGLALDDDAKVGAVRPPRVDAYQCMANGCGIGRTASIAASWRASNVREH